jgi:cation diffusion facilitator CzcD-associated flavoprotein CzcO
MAQHIPVIVIGGGPAGLATSQQLKKNGIEHLVLEKGDVAVAAWRGLYDSLTLHTAKHLSTLPDLAFPKETPLFVPKDAFLEYLDDYVSHFELSIKTSCEVKSLEKENGKWILKTNGEEFTCDSVVIATGLISSPQSPTFEGQDSFGGEILHSVSYKNPEPFQDKKVLVVGVGNSGGEIASELARAGVDVCIAVRSGARNVPLKMAGIPIQYFGYVLRFLPEIFTPIALFFMALMGRILRGAPVLPVPPRNDKCSDVPLIGFNLADEIRSGSIRVFPGIKYLNETGAFFTDGSEQAFDSILLATGFSPAVEFMGKFDEKNECGFADRFDRIASKNHEGLFFVGHNYDMTGGLANIRQDSRLVGKALKKNS